MAKVPQILNFLVWCIAAETVRGEGIVEKCVYAQKPAEFTEEYPEGQYWVDVCLRHQPPGYESCQECIDKVWCDERTLCWDPDIEKQIPCTHVDLHLGSTPTYPQCPCVYAQDTPQYTQQYPEAQYWIDVCLLHQPSGYESCQACTNKVWCNEGATCWDPQLQKPSPCTEVSLYYGSNDIFPTYPQCPGSPAPPLAATVLFSSYAWGTSKRCHKKFRASGDWGDLGLGVSEEMCFTACRLWKTCKYVSFEPDAPSGQTGTCTSFTACDRKQRKKGQKTWEKVFITPSAECKDKKSENWCTRKSKEGMCTKPSVAKNCERTCGLCDRRRLLLAHSERKTFQFV